MPRFVNHVGLDHQVLIDEFRRIGVVGQNATNLRRGHVNLVDALILEKCPDVGLLSEVKFAAVARNDIGIATVPQLAHDC